VLILRRILDSLGVLVVPVLELADELASCGPVSLQPFLDMVVVAGGFLAR